MLGAIAGDIIGSVYEHDNIKSTDFPLFSRLCRFTDDTVLTVAVAHALLDGLDYAGTLKSYGRRFPKAGYGGSFIRWLFSESLGPYNSWGNGSAMRVSPVGFWFNSVEKVLAEAERTAAVTHNHPEGIKGAKAVALAVFLARSGVDKTAIKYEIESRFSYDLSRTIDEIRPGYKFDVSCRGSVPEAIVAFLESIDYEDAVRKAVSIGGDSDTIACISGAIAHAFYGRIPKYIVNQVRSRLSADLLQVVDKFQQATTPRIEEQLGSAENLGEFYEAYLKTSYVVEDISVTLRVGEANADLNRLLASYEQESAAFLTAYNPYSKELPSQENEARQNELFALLKERNYEYFKGFGAGDDSSWGPEPSVLIPDIDPTAALAIARRFQQNAIVFIAKGKPPVLVHAADKQR
jgi:ADP-ribosylglycohydrolase